MAIISLVKIKKYNLRGRWLAIVTIILWILTVISIAVVFGLIIYAFADCGNEYYFEVPMTVTVSGSNFEIKEIKNADKPDIFLFTYNNTNLETALEKCSLDSFQFGMADPFIYESQDSKLEGGHLKGPQTSEMFLTKNYSGSGDKEYILSFKEPFGTFRQMKGAIKDMLENNKKTFYIPYSLTAFNQKKPVFANEIESYGCRVIRRYVFDKNATRDGGFLKITELSGGTNLSPKRILCVKPFKEIAGKNDYSEDNCTFFELTSEIEINYNIDLDKGENKVYHQPCL